MLIKVFVMLYPDKTRDEYSSIQTSYELFVFQSILSKYVLVNFFVFFSSKTFWQCHKSTSRFILDDFQIEFSPKVFKNFVSFWVIYKLLDLEVEAVEVVDFKMLL